MLSEILHQLPIREVIGTAQRPVAHITSDSRMVQADGLFVAVIGTQTDGHRFIDEAVQRGATSVVCMNLPEQLREDICYVRVADSSVALARLAENFYDQPSSQLTVVAVTGTNGKTTVATLLYQMFRYMNYSCGLLSTIENRINDERVAATLTTPSPVDLSHWLYRMNHAGCRYCFMEASSHAIDQNRLAGIRLSGAVFTNISHDHLDYHKTFDAYIKAKKKLFDQLPATAFALVNRDDRRASVMVQNTAARCYTYSLRRAADFRGKLLDYSMKGLSIRLDGHEVQSTLIGAYNASNLVAAYGVAHLLGMETVQSLTALSMAQPPKGRLDRIIHEPTHIIGVVDYAHSPDALKNVLQTLYALRTKRSRIITVVGCGGDRDRTKRPLMGALAARLSDTVIFTADNPRNEPVADILRQMQEHLTTEQRKKVLVIEDRRQAIRTAVFIARPTDVVLVAGKGHETYQEIAGQRIPFDDKEELVKALEERGLTESGTQST